MHDFEKLGLFYLGNVFDPKKQKTTSELLLYDSKDLTTHAICLGMTGSGKTGLGIGLLEEAALDKIPAIVVDPKGDVANLLLTFPKLSPEEFAPWVDPAEAERKGVAPDAYAKVVAKTWKEGLAASGETPERIQKLKDSVDMVIYTPASKAGVPISILSSFAAPSKETVLDPNAMRDKVLSTTSSLLGLLGIKADPIKSREHILLSTLIDQAWRHGLDLDLAGLIQQVQKPPLDKIGALSVDTFFPPKERTALAVGLNNLLASPGFHAWMEGEPLDINRFLYTSEGKPKLSIISIAHLSDPERMFFVTLLLNELLGWMRRQSGTSSLRALFYMDEVFGYFPPTAMPPCKTPLLTLLKQARAFGLGIVLATQNPVDLDYKGLSNCGTWFIGKLQTERDRARVLEGLNIASNGDIDAKTLETLISSITTRVFIMRSIYEKQPILFQTRWTMSYLRGPLTLAQIEKLMKTVIKALAPPVPASKKSASETANKGSVAPGVNEFFVNENSSELVLYKPLVAGRAKLHFVNAKSKIDVWQDVCVIAPPLDGGKTIDWSHGKDLLDIKNLLKESPLPHSTFEDLPAGLMQEKNYASFAQSFATWLYQNHALSIYQYPELNLSSEEKESEQDFRARVALALREQRDAIVQKLRDKYGQKITILNERLRRAQEKLEQQKQQAGIQKTEAWMSVGATILGTLFGKKVTQGTLSQAGTSMRRIGRISKENQEAQHAEENVQALQKELDAVKMQLDEEIAKAPSTMDPSTIQISSSKISPRKADTSIGQISVVWLAT